MATHAGISDERSDFVKDAEKRQALMQRALAWMIENNLGPTQPNSLKIMAQS